MKKRVFKYRIIGILLFLIEVFIFILFSFGSYDSFANFTSQEIFSQESCLFLFAVAVAFTSFLSLISLLFRSRYTILFLNIHYSIILLLFLIGMMQLIYRNDYYKEDNWKFITIISIILILIFMVNFFKIKRIDFLELDEIGKPN
ncbi:hypothetical protein [Chryseobacterium binzhouense]|uniref:hypothetical protein n=1 Tax=Chryseobacterium binzhouense TaxID=2593646 RepID=UPI00117E824C|nr:hypothetical protein [Chryseobacterium binzhouense]